MKYAHDADVVIDITESVITCCRQCRVQRGAAGSVECKGSCFLWLALHFTLSVMRGMCGTECLHRKSDYAM